MKTIKKLIQMPFLWLIGFLGIVICAHYEFGKYLWKNK